MICINKKCHQGMLRISIINLSREYNFWINLYEEIEKNKCKKLDVLYRIHCYKIKIYDIIIEKIRH